MKKIVLSILMTFVFLCFLTPGWADTLLYDNGSMGTSGILAIYGTYQVSDSFSLSANSDLSKIQIGLWVVSGDKPQTVDWAIGIGPTGYASDLYSGSDASLTTTPTPYSSFGSYDIYEASFSPGNLPLSQGNTYWLTLKNGGTSNSGPVWWGESNGPSTVYDTFYPGTPGSESFQIYGPSSPVPEPTTVLLLGLGLICLAGLLRKSKRQIHIA